MGNHYFYNWATLKKRIVSCPFSSFVFPFGCFFFFFFIVCFTSYFMFSTAVLPHSPGVVYYHLLLRQETRIHGVTPFSFRIGIWDLFVHRGQKSYTPIAFGKLWTPPGVRCKKTCLIIIRDPGLRPGRKKNCEKEYKKIMGFEN